MLSNPLRILWLVFFLLGGVVSAEPKFHTVVLDPGHGGKDNGASWYGLDEKTINLDVAKRVETILRKKGIPTVMTRRTDKYVALADRAKTANKYDNSVFVSIHFNAHTNRTIHGIETFYYTPAGAKLAKPVQKALSYRTASKDRGIKKYPYKVLLLTKSTAILVECGFMSNKSESAKMKTDAHKQRVAEAIAAALIEARR